MHKPIHRFSEQKKEGLYDAIYKRRDVREFLPDPVPQDALERILSAAHHAGSVGDGHRVYVEAVGEGIPVVFLHGSDQRPPLAARGK